MGDLTRWRGWSWLLVVLGMLMVVPSAAAQTSSPGLAVFSDTTATCNTTGKLAPAITQGEAISVQLLRFPAGADAKIWLTFPDGRVFSPAALPLLTGVIDLPVDSGFALSVDGVKEPFTTFASNALMPTGCYTLRATSTVGPTTAGTNLVIQADPILKEVNPGLLKLIVQNQTTKQPRGPQGTVVEIFGRDFPNGATRTLQLIQPNGTVLDIPLPTPPPTVQDTGFHIAISMPNVLQTGVYTFVATATPASAAKPYRIATNFELTAASLAPQGIGILRVSDPFTLLPKQGDTLQIQGNRFTAGAIPMLTLILPNGAVRNAAVLPTLAGPAVDANGDFPLALTLDQRFPTGSYRIVATSGPPSTSATATFRLTPAP